MYELPVKGEIRTIACRQGSSGIFTGPLRGLYQGYRFGSTTPDVTEHTLQFENGSIALSIRQSIMTMLQNRPEVHPFADGHDPFVEDEYVVDWVPEVYGGPPVELPMPAGMGEGGYEVRKTHYMEVIASVDPEKSTGIFAGATGKMEIEAPEYRFSGHMELETEHGTLRLPFLERGAKLQLIADFWVDGEASTGIWKGAEGELTFHLSLKPPKYGRGPYEGVIRLAQEPPEGLLTQE